MNENHEISEIMGRRFARSSCYIAGAIGVILGAIIWFISFVTLKTTLLVIGVNVVLIFVCACLSVNSNLRDPFNALSGGAFATTGVLHFLYSHEFKGSMMSIIVLFLVICMVLLIVFVLGAVLVRSVFEESRTQTQQKDFENVG